LAPHSPSALRPRPEPGRRALGVWPHKRLCGCAMVRLRVPLRSAWCMGTPSLRGSRSCHGDCYLLVCVAAWLSSGPGGGNSWRQ
jgi:hypothetical protein